LNLYEIKSEMKALVDEETGEVLDLEQFLEYRKAYELYLTHSEELEWLIKLYKNEKAIETAISNEINVLNERREKCRNRAERYLGHMAYLTQGQRFECAIGTIRHTTRPHVVVDDGFTDWAVKSGFDYMLRHKPPEVDKTAVKAALKAGMDIPAHFEDTTSTTVWTANSKNASDNDEL